MSIFYTDAFLMKGKIYVRGYNGGKPFSDVYHCRPYLFSSNRKDGHVSLTGKACGRVDFTSPWEARKYVQEYKDSNVQIFDYNLFLYQWLNDEFPGEIEYDPDVISVVSLDIEVDSEKGFPEPEIAADPITAVTLRKNGKAIIFTVKPYDPPEDVQHVLCNDEVDLLQKFLEVWRSDEWVPDVVTGWNVEFFDITYLVNRIVVLLGERHAKKMSPWGFIEKKSVFIQGGREQTTYTLFGITVLDYLQLYKKFSFSNEESYKLNHIAHVVLDEKKIDYSEYQSLSQLYRMNPQKYFDYNIHDTVLVDKLEEKLGFIKQVFSLAYDAKVLYPDTLATIRSWDVIIRNELMKRKITVINEGGDHSNLRRIAGGYVKEPYPGLHEHVVSFDFTSLYPHLIMQYNISPETYLGIHPQLAAMGVEGFMRGDADKIFEELKQKGVTATPNGAMFDITRPGILAEVMEKMFNDRAVYKRKMMAFETELEKMASKESPEAMELKKQISRYHNLQLSKKIQLNAGYGAIANQYFRWFSLERAEAITLAGQLSTRWAEREMNAYLCKLLGINHDFVIASDTDSMYVCLDKLVEAVDMKDAPAKDRVLFIDDVCKSKIEPFIARKMDELSVKFNARENKMKMKRELIMDRMIVRAAKMYVSNVWVKEDVYYDKPKVKMVGIEAVRSSTPQVCRDAIKKSLEIIMNKKEEDLRTFYEEFKSKFMKMPFHEVAKPTGVNGVREYSDPVRVFREKTPMHVKGSLIYNDLLKKNNLDSKYPLIHDGDKIKVCYLRMPNIIKNPVIACPDGVPLPEEFRLDEYVDKDTQFEKNYIQPLKSFTDSIGWKLEEEASLEGLFC